MVEFLGGKTSNPSNELTIDHQTKAILRFTVLRNIKERVKYSKESPIQINKFYQRLRYMPKSSR